jgi:hypothetical protein
MKKFLIGCVGFSALCLAISCGQLASKQPANGAGGQPGSSQWAHATVSDGTTQQRCVVNLAHVTCITDDGIAVLPAAVSMGPGGAGAHSLERAMVKIDAADIPK